MAVVGAGLAGLRAAERLHAAGRRVLVLEARDEVGGRLRSRKVAGQAIDLGGELVSAGYRHLPGLVGELGLHLEPTGLGHAAVRWHPSLRPRPDQLRALGRVLRALQGLTRSLPAQAPWTAVEAGALDAASFSDWLDHQRLDGEARALVEVVVSNFTTAAASQISLLQVLWWLRADGGALGALWRAGRWRLREGAQQIAHRLHQRLEGRVCVGSPVSAIAEHGHHVTLTLAHGAQTISAGAAIVTAPLAVIDRIAFNPPLDAQQRALSQLQVSRVTKVVAMIGSQRRPPFHRLALTTGRLRLAWRHRRRLEGFALDADADLAAPELVDELADAFGLASQTWPGATCCAGATSPTSPVATRPRRPGS